MKFYKKSYKEYERLAELYDAIYAAQGKDYQNESRLIHEAIEKHKLSPGQRLLDVACGTGGHFQFLKQWYTVTGLDISESMLAVAKKRLPDFTFHQGDMVDFNLADRFDAITCLFSAIGYAKTPEKMEAAISNMARHLNPGGVLVVEPWFSPQQWKVGRPSAAFVDQKELKIARMNIAEKKGNISIVNFHFLVATPDGVEHFTEHHELGLFTPDQYLAAFKKAGLKVEFDPVGIAGRGLYLGLKK